MATHSIVEMARQGYVRWHPHPRSLAIWTDRREGSALEEQRKRPEDGVVAFLWLLVKASRLAGFDGSHVGQVLWTTCW